MKAGEFAHSNQAMIAHYVFLAFAIVAGAYAHQWDAAWAMLIMSNIWAAANYIAKR
jgi:hypothetical protein